MQEDLTNLPHDFGEITISGSVNNDYLDVDTPINKDSGSVTVEDENYNDKRIESTSNEDDDYDDVDDEEGEASGSYSFDFSLRSRR